VSDAAPRFDAFCRAAPVRRLRHDGVGGMVAPTLLRRFPDLTRVVLSAAIGEFVG
jgi:hypothetical protein